MGIAFNQLSKIRLSQCSLSGQFLPCQRYGNNIVLGPERRLCDESLNGLLCQVRRDVNCRGENKSKFDLAEQWQLLGQARMSPSQGPPPTG